MAETDIVLKNHLEQRKQNAKCTTQNEIISIIAVLFEDIQQFLYSFSTSVLSIIITLGTLQPSGDC